MTSNSNNNNADHHHHNMEMERSSNHSMHSMMKMYFHFGTDETILFNFWKVESPFGIFLSCIVIIIACFCLEFIRWYRIFRKKQFLAEVRNSGEIEDQHSRRRVRLATICDACMHAVQLALSYSLMLVFMTFNVWLGLAIIIGEVMARIVLSLFYPQLDLFLTFFGAASAEPCCG